MQAPAERKPIRWVSWQEKSRGRSMPSTPGSPFLQSVFISPVPPPAPAPVLVIKDPYDVVGNTMVFGKEFVRKYFLLWYWASYTALRALGLDFGVTLFAALICMFVGCISYGCVKAREASRKAKGLPGVAWQPPLPTPATSATGPASISAHSPPAHVNAAWTPPPSISAPPPAQGTPWTPPVNSPPPTAVTPVVSDPFVGNSVLGIYHVGNCDWVDRISTKNRVGFSTGSEAASHGFKPCRICSPATD